MMNNWFISVNPSQFGELKVWFGPTPPNLRLQSTVAALSTCCRSPPGLSTTCDGGEISVGSRGTVFTSVRSNTKNDIVTSISVTNLVPI